MDAIDEAIARARGGPSGGVDEAISRARSGRQEEEDYDINPFERTVLSGAMGVIHGLRKAANWSFGMPSAPDAIQEKAVQEEKALIDKLTKGHFWTGEAPAFIGEMIPSAVVTLPLGAPAGVGMLGRAAAGAVQGGVMGSMMGEPGSQEESGAIGAAVGGPMAAAAPPVVNFLLRGGERASRGAVNLFKPTVDRLREVAEKWVKEGEPIEAGVIRAGEELRKLRGVNGKRLVSGGQTMGDRAMMLDALGEQAGLEIDDVLMQADAEGLRANPTEVLGKLKSIRDRYFGGAPQDLTSTQRQGRAAADDLIKRYRSAYGEYFKDAGPVIGRVQGETRPLAFPRRDPDTGAVLRDKAGNVVEDQMLSLDRVGATSPQPTRVFDPPEKVGPIQKKDAKGRFMKGEPAPQPHLQESRMVDVPEETTIFSEGAQSGPPTHGYVRLESPQPPELPAALRKRLEKNGIDTARRLTEEEISNPNIRKIILADKDMGPRAKRLLLQTGTTFDPEIAALRRVKWRQEMMQDPDFVGEIARKLEINRQPLSAHEAAKRVVGREGYLRGAKYFDANAAAQDPGVQFFRKAYGVMKGDVEEALTPALRDRFLPAKEASQLAQVFGPQGETAALIDMLPSSSIRSSVHGQVKSNIIEAALDRSRPYRIQANEILEKIGKNLPAHTQDALRATIVEMLRQKETR